MRTIVKFIAGGALVLSAVSVANAGGYQRGQADIDILFEPGNFSTRLGANYVNPRRAFESVTLTPGTPGFVAPGNTVDGGDIYTGSYIIPQMSVMFGGGDIGACAGTYTESFAADADYRSLPGGATPVSVNDPNAPFGSRTRFQEFDSNEISLNCRLSYNLNRGRVSLIGGVFFEDFNFEASSFAFAPGAAGPVTLPIGTGGAPVTGILLVPTQADIEMRGGYQTGFRVGAAYEIPEIALRAQVVYRSEVKHDDISGTAFITAQGAPNILVTGAGPIAVPGTPLPEGFALGQEGASLNNTTSPQSLNINVQTGIAEGTLLLGSFRWTDWSTNQAAIVTVAGNDSVTPFRWRDGYTASLGLGRAFNENISGLAQVGYDRGVSTGADTTYTDLYTLSGGLSLRESFGELRVGGLIGYWTDGEQSIDRGANFDATVGDDWVYGATASFKLTF